MTAITYGVVRSIIKINYTKIGTDIFAQTSDDSFNSTSTDLSGLVTGNGIFVSGFTEETLNDWWEVVANSTTTKILVDLGVLDEAAGNTIVIEGYEYFRGQIISFDVKTRGVDQSSRITSDRQIALGGASETSFHRTDSIYEMTVGPYNETEADFYWQFFDSVSGGETFTIDPDGTVAVPDNPISVKLDVNLIRPQRISLTDWFTVRLRMVGV